jgi:hypothetical protein
MKDLKSIKWILLSADKTQAKKIPNYESCSNHSNNKRTYVFLKNQLLFSVQFLTYMIWLMLSDAHDYLAKFNLKDPGK